MNPAVLLVIQVVVVLATTQVCGWLARLLRQPRVVGEIAGGILLGPIALGQFLPAIEHALFAAGTLRGLEWISNVGLVTFLFFVGNELDLSEVRGRFKTVGKITVGSVVLPFLLGIAIAPSLMQRFGIAHSLQTGFIVFTGIAMSVTALPVLARILKDREEAGRPVDANVAQQSLLSAALNDALAWCVLAVVLATLHGGAIVDALPRLGLLVAFVVAMLAVVKPLLRRIKIHALGWVVLFTILAGGGAWITDVLGIHLFFGAFLAGVCAPHDVLTGRVESAARLVATWTLPAFFALTGLRMRPELFHASGWVWFLLVLAAAVIGKIGGGIAGARLGGTSWPVALRIGVLLNTRGLVELIVLNAGYREGILNAPVFTLLVLMAVITTAMTGPLLDAFD